MDLASPSGPRLPPSRPSRFPHAATIPLVPRRISALRPDGGVSTVWLATGAGTALVVLLAVDAFLTLLHASSGAGPYTAMQNRAIWSMARALARVAGPLRRPALSLAAPAMALATPLGWLLLLTVGFALLYLPVVDHFPAQPPVEVPSWLTSLYYSAYLTTTLGLGDVVPRGGLWRMATVLQAGLGFALFSGSITYILTIYRRYTDEASLALRLHGLFSGEGGEEAPAARDPSGSEPTSAYAEPAGDWLALDLAAAVSSVNVAHHQYPILHYFHGDDDRALTVQIGHLARLVEEPAGLSPRARRSLGRAVEEYLEHMPFSTGSGTLRERHAALLRAHGYGGAARS